RAITGPFVPGVHARTSHESVSLTGETMNPDKRSFAQPGCPQSHGSRCPFSNPHAVICLIAHSPAAFRFGEPGQRGPYTSVRKCIVGMICELSVASFRIFALTSAAFCANTGAYPAPNAHNMSIARTLSIALLLFA